MKDIFALRLYTRVARLGSFSAAARECGLSQSQASRLVADLEAEIGVRLLSRTTRAVVPTIKETDMTKTTPEQNKALVLEAFDTLFNKRDYDAAERFWSDCYIQHSAHIAPGRSGLFDLIRAAPDTLRYENQLIVAEGDYVIAHGRFSGHGRPAAWIAADIVRIEDGKLAEHWDVLQDEATQADSVSGLPMFGDRFPA
jgi:predicted SnoaL-like aldol condensation-catalyzing enzyme